MKTKIFLIILSFVYICGCRFIYTHNNNNKYLPVYKMPDSFLSFPIENLSDMKKRGYNYYDDTTDIRVRRFISEKGCCNDYTPVPTYIYRHVELSSSNNLIAYFEYDDKGILKHSDIIYHAELPYRFIDGYLLENVGSISQSGVGAEDHNICWKEAIKLSRWHGVKGGFPYISYRPDCFYDSIHYERINCYIVVGTNKKFVKIDTKTGKVLKIGNLRDTIRYGKHYWMIPLQNQYIDIKCPKRRL